MQTDRRTAYAALVRFESRALDSGVRTAVALLNRVRGVVTRASCEGGGKSSHADLAYVVLRYPMPLRLQDFLSTRLGTLARVEDEGVYSRWPERNSAFLEALSDGVRAYLSAARSAPVVRIRSPLPRLRAQLAHALLHSRAADAGVCFTCRRFIVAPHEVPHDVVVLLIWPADQMARWFADFVREQGNELDAALIAHESWTELAARSRNGDFGPAFHRRWLRYRSRRLALAVTSGIRQGAQRARRAGTDIDFSYDESAAFFTWPARRS